MIGSLLGLLIGIGTLILGVQGFTKSGLPVTSKKRMTGTSARIVGALLILFGLFLILFAAYGIIAVMRELSAVGGVSQ